MLDGLKPYPAYRESAVPWLGKVPEHWDVRRLKSLFREVDRRSSTGTERLLSLRQASGLVDHEQAGGRPIAPEHLVGFKVVQPGEIVMNRMRASAGLFAVVATPGLVSPDYAVFRPTGPLSTGYFVRLFRTSRMGTTFRMESRGLGTGESGFLRLYSDSFGRLSAPYPSEAEQSSIARFLGHADRAVRRFVRDRQELSKLLDERKTAVINHVATEGLEAKDGLKALGSVPDVAVNARWRTSRLSAVSRLRSETGRTDLPLLSVFLGRGVIPYAEGGGQVHKPSLDLSAYQVVHPGDLVLNNQQAWRGSVGVSEYLGITSPAYLVLDLDSDILPPFARYLFQARAMVDQFVTSSKGVGDIQRDVCFPWLRNAQVPIPPLREQVEIAALLDHEVCRLSAASRMIDREISLFREFLAHLVSKVVLGELDVRDAACGLADAAGHQGVSGDDDVNEIDAGDDASEEASSIEADA